MEQIKDKENFQNILDFIESQLVFTISEYASRRRRLKLPLVPPKIFQSLLVETAKVLSQESTLLDISGDFIIVGCLYGNVVDLLQILTKYGSPARQKYLFLGNLVGRGEFSVDVVLMVYLIKVLFPENVYIIRGDSEFPRNCMTNGFKEEIDMKYDKCNLYPHFMKSFSFLPLAAVINKKAFCVSGGIGKNIYDLEAIKSIKRPILAMNDQLIQELLVSDPTDGLPMFLPATRGEGNLFGAQAVAYFFKETKVSLFFRGRQPVQNGFEKKFDGLLVSICSASGLERDNKSGVYMYGPIMDQGESFECLPQVKRTDVNYIASMYDDKWEIQKTSNFTDSPSNLSFSDYLSSNSGLRLSTLTVGTANIQVSGNRKVGNSLLRKPSMYQQSFSNTSPKALPQRHTSLQGGLNRSRLASKQILQF